MARRINRARNILWLLLALSFFIGCRTATKTEPPPPIPFNYQPTKDSVIQKMISWELAGQVDSISSYLNHRNPNFRYQALKTFTTPRDSEQLQKLIPLIKDSISAVRQLAIYAAGQQGDKQALPALQAAYNPWDSTGTYQEENARILEAIGKCGSRIQLEQLAAIKTFTLSDSLLIAGQAHGIFQLLLKGLSSEAAIETMTKYFFSPQQPLPIRQIAGYYLMRGNELALDAYEFSFGKILRSNDHFSLRLNAAAVMANSGNRKYANILLEQLGREKNDQVKLNILRALYKMPYNRAKSKVFQEISNDNPQISRMAARFFLINGQTDDAAQYWDKVKNRKLDPVTTAYFAAATIKNLPFYYALTRNSAIRQLNNALNGTDDPYIKAQLLQVMAELPDQINNVLAYYQPEADPVIKSQVVFCVQKAAQVARQERKLINTVNRAARILFDRIIQDGDAGALAAMAYVILDSTSTDFHALFRRQNNLLARLDSLDLPKEIETYNEIALLLNSYQINSVQPVEASGFKTFNSDRYSQLTADAAVTVNTSSGAFTIQLFVDESPISVTNFVELIDDGYFNDKVFHRVVPNFVIQTGCPRGDGYGSQDYVIRSELAPLRYNQAGRVGMASAGNDTESSQWFVTHLPTFHLDGRYTIFGQVTSGMDVINSIQMGDKINSIEIIN